MTRRQGCATLLVGLSLVASALALWLVLLASAWGDPPSGFRFVHFVGGLALGVAGAVLSLSGAARLLTPRRRRER